MLNQLICWYKGHIFYTHYDLTKMAYTVKNTDCCTRCNKTRDTQKTFFASRVRT